MRRRRCALFGLANMPLRATQRQGADKGGDHPAGASRHDPIAG
jgi:hypothetical protein